MPIISIQMDLIIVITIFVLSTFMQCSNQTKYKKNKKCTYGTLQGILKTEHKHQLQLISDIIIYKEMFLDCDWSVSVQLIPDRSAKICSKQIWLAENTKEFKWANHVKTIFEVILNDRNLQNKQRWLLFEGVKSLSKVLLCF
jgi:hypothetical protein